MSGIPSISPAWRDRLAVLGGVAACVVAAKTARLLWLRAQLRFGPVLVSKFKGQWALVTGGESSKPVIWPPISSTVHALGAFVKSHNQHFLSCKCTALLSGPGHSVVCGSEKGLCDHKQHQD